MTITFPDPCETIVADVGVYAPQHDSRLLVEMLQRTQLAPGRRVLDLCTGSGVSRWPPRSSGGRRHGLRHLPARRAVLARQRQSRRAWRSTSGRVTDDALDCAPFDVVVSNPPYVPTPPDSDSGSDSRRTRDRRGRGTPASTAVWCWTRCAPRRRSCCTDGGTMLIVQSEFAGRRAIARGPLSGPAWTPKSFCGN